jgi:hypothetical protein
MKTLKRSLGCRGFKRKNEHRRWSTGLGVSETILYNVDMSKPIEHTTPKVKFMPEISALQ